MAKKNILHDFTSFMLSNEETDNLKGGRNRIPINTGSYGFINWDDVDVRDPGLVINIGANAVPIVRKKGH